MQHFLQGVNDGRFVLLLRDIIKQEVSELFGRDITDRDMDVG